MSAHDEELPSFPIWTMEFGATYPYEDLTPYALGGRRLRQFTGSHGFPLGDVPLRERIDPWLPQILPFPASHQKFEWNCKGEKRDIWQFVIQFRASGVRVKRPTTAPSLVAMCTTQIPIIAWER